MRSGWYRMVAQNTKRMRLQFNRVVLGKIQPIYHDKMATNEKGVNAVVQVERGDNDGANNHEGNNNHEESFGGDIDVPAGARGLFGYSKLHAAVSSGQAAVLKLLLAEDPNSSDVNGKTVDGGYTPLHLAASAGHAECVEELLTCHKTDMHVTDAFGRTPLETAEQNFKNDVAKLLRSHGKSLYAL